MNRALYNPLALKIMAKYRERLTEMVREGKMPPEEAERQLAIEMRRLTQRRV